MLGSLLRLHASAGRLEHVLAEISEDTAAVLARKRKKAIPKTPTARPVPKASPGSPLSPWDHSPTFSPTIYAVEEDQVEQEPKGTRVKCIWKHSTSGFHPAQARPRPQAWQMGCRRKNASKVRFSRGLRVPVEAYGRAYVDAGDEVEELDKMEDLLDGLASAAEELGVDKAIKATGK